MKKVLCTVWVVLAVMAFAACSDLSFLHKGFGFVAGPGATPAPSAPSAPSVVIVAPPVSASPSPTPEASPGPSLPDIGGYVPSQAELEIIAQLNEQRTEASLPAFTTSQKLCAIAHVKAQEMYDLSYFAHTSPNYGSMSDMLHSFGVTFQSMGENIARIADPATLVKAWMDSPDHRQNILNERCRQVGVGIVGNYYVAVFAD